MRNQKGQSILEITAVITLVTIVIFFAGPTVIRSINAHFKLWDDSIQDSYNDPLKEAPPLNETLNCKFEWAGSGCNVFPCKATEHLERLLCNPATCCEASGMQTERCVTDNACCEEWRPTDQCCFGENSPTPTPGAMPTNCPTGNRIFQRT